MVNIPEIDEPFDRYIAFLVERDRIYQKKSAGEPWPWTEDHILQTYRFTEVYRERDRTSLHYQKTIRDFYSQYDPIIFPATVLYRWFNRMKTCEALFCEPDLNNQTIFERFITSDCEKLSILADCINKLSPPHVTGAFIITGRQGYEKGIGVLHYFYDWCKKPWRSQWVRWIEKPPTLQDMFLWIRTESQGLGTFMGAQLVADLKYLPFMKDVCDWWSWAAPGPGSMRGLNVVCGNPVNQTWREAEWLEKIQWLNGEENRELKPYGLGPFHCQDTQNHCCEFSKYTKTMNKEGRPRQTYHHG